MANIFSSNPGWVKDRWNTPFRVEWQDDDNLIRERYFNSYQEAEHFALEIERLLLREAVDDICAMLPPHRPPKSKVRKR